MKKILGIIDTVKKHWKLILMYHLSITFVSFIFLTELEINRKVSFSFYCILGSTVVFVTLAHRLAENSFSEGYGEGYETAQLDNEVHWKGKYSELLKTHEKDGLILPIQITDNCKILSVEKVSERNFHGENFNFESVWHVTGIQNKMFIERYIVRSDEETFTGLIEALKSTRCFEEISLLDLREDVS